MRAFGVVLLVVIIALMMFTVMLAVLNFQRSNMPMLAVNVASLMVQAGSAGLLIFVLIRSRDAG